MCLCLELLESSFNPTGVLAVPAFGSGSCLWSCVLSQVSSSVWGLLLLSCCSASNFSFFFFPKVPVIPVVYSSFTTFYNPKKHLFTSGTREPEWLQSPLETG